MRISPRDAIERSGGDEDLDIDNNSVAGPSDPEFGTIQVSGTGVDHSLTVDSHRLYTVRQGDYSEGTVRLKVSPGLEVFSFTFG